jgi:hypothetical protein
MLIDLIAKCQCVTPLEESRFAENGYMSGAGQISIELSAPVILLGRENRYGSEVRDSVAIENLGVYNAAVQAIWEMSGRYLSRIMTSDYVSQVPHPYT